jgi:hypothetical protein
VLLLAWIPWNLGLLIAGMIGMIVGAEIERRMTPNGAPHAGPRHELFRRADLDHHRPSRGRDLPDPVLVPWPDRQPGLPEWVLRHLRYTAVAILPAMVAPLVLWPAANGGEPDPARLAAAAVTLGVGFVLKNPIFGIVAASEPSSASARSSGARPEARSSCTPS